jgi:hypothetical protein
VAPLVYISLYGSLILAIAAAVGGALSAHPVIVDAVWLRQ